MTPSLTCFTLQELRGDGRVGRQEAERLSPSRKVVSEMADSIDPKIDDESTDPKKRFGTGRASKRC
jgi:hypothetical protein